MGHAQFHKGRMKGDDPEIDTAQTPKRFDRRLALLGKTRKTFTDSIPNKNGFGFSSCPRFTFYSTQNKPPSTCPGERSDVHQGPSSLTKSYFSSGEFTGVNVRGHLTLGVNIVNFR